MYLLFCFSGFVLVLVDLICLFMYERLNILIGFFLCLLENEDPGNDILACPICKKKYLSVETKEKHLIQFHRKKCYPGKLLKEN